MPPRRVKLNYKGKLVEAVEMPFEAQEGVSTYTLEDGTIVTLRVVLVQLAKLIGEYDQDGNAVYLTKSTTVQGTSPLEPEGLVLAMAGQPGTISIPGSEGPGGSGESPANVIN